MWKFWDRSAARLVVGEEPRMVFKEKYSGAGLFMLRSLKLNAPGPKLFDADRLELLRELYISLQCHGMREGGCMAAKGDEASIVAANCNTAPTNVSAELQQIENKYTGVIRMF